MQKFRAFLKGIATSARGQSDCWRNLQAQQLARTGKKLAAAPKPAAAKKAIAKQAAVERTAVEGATEIAGRPDSAAPGTPNKAEAAARECNTHGSPQASSEATHLLAELAGDEDADSARAAGEEGAPGKENAPAADTGPPHAAGLTPVKRPLQAKMQGSAHVSNASPCMPSQA